MKGDAEILQSGRVILRTTLRLCILYRRRRAGFASSEAPRKKMIRTREEETITDSIAAACRPSPPPNYASQVGGPLCYDVFVNFFFNFFLPRLE